MKITSVRWLSLVEAIERQAKAINAKSDRHNYNVEECSKNGATETVINMIVELESTLRVLKRRLKETLPSDNGTDTKSEGQQAAQKILMGCNHPIGTPAWDYLTIEIAKEIDGPIK